MALKFVCPVCGGVIVRKYLRVGENSRCPQCGAVSAVPEAAIPADEPSDVETRPTPLPPLPCASTASAEFTDAQIRRGRWKVRAVMVLWLGVFAVVSIHWLIERRTDLGSVVAGGVILAIVLHMLHRGVRWIRHLLVALLLIPSTGIVVWVLNDWRNMEWSLLLVVLLPCSIVGLIVWLLAFSIDVKAFLHDQKMKWLA